MSKILRDLLDAEEPIFSLSLRQLEAASGHKGVDAALIGEIARKMRESIETLGLDPDDTTGPELYAALMARMKVDNERVTKLIGGTDADDVKHMVPLMVKAVENMKINREAWVLKEIAWLNEHPPNRVRRPIRCWARSSPVVTGSRRASARAAWASSIAPGTSSSIAWWPSS